MKFIQVDYDPQSWAEIPLSFPQGEFSTRAEWAAGLAAVFASDTDSGPEAERMLCELASRLDFGESPGLFAMLWHHPSPDTSPLIVRVLGIPADGLEQVALSELADAYDDTWVRPPMVDSFGSSVFGEFTRVVGGFRDAGGRKLKFRCVHVGRCEDTLVRLDGITSDLGDGMLAVDDMTSLMDAVNLIEVGG